MPVTYFWTQTEASLSLCVVKDKYYKTEKETSKTNDVLNTIEIEQTENRTIICMFVRAALQQWPLIGRLRTARRVTHG